VSFMQHPCAGVVRRMGASLASPVSGTYFLEDRMVFRRRRTRRFLILLSIPVMALALAGAQLALPATPASAQIQTNTQFYNAWDNLCLVPTGTSDAPVLQTECANSSIDKWHAAGPDYPYVFQIENTETGQCLGVAGGSTSEGAQVVMWKCNGSENQNWETLSSCGGVGSACQYENLSSALLLSVDGCNDDPGDSIDMWGSVPLPGGYCQWWNWADF
jgi:hypothetical protein